MADIGLTDAVRGVGGGGSAFDPEVLSQMLCRHRDDDPLEQLTSREREVLGLMAEERSKGTIAAELAGGERAVEKYVTGIFAKPDLSTSSEDHRRALAVLHFYDQPACAPPPLRWRSLAGALVGYGTRNDGDLALGILAVLAIWFRDRFLLAVVIVAAISLWGDAYGHIHQAAVNDNHDPDNILFPLVAVTLYAVRERLSGKRREPCRFR